MNKITPHEPDEPLTTVEVAFADASASEARWRSFDLERGVKRVAIELPTPLYDRLEKVASERNQSVPILIEHVIEELALTFGAS